MGYLDYKIGGIEDMRDEEILALSLRKPSHFSVIVDRYQGAFLRNVRKVLGNRDEVEDVVQEAFTKIYMNASRFQEVDGAKFSSWAYKILFNTAFTYYQKTKKKENFFINVDDEILHLVPDLSIDSLDKRGLRDEVANIISRMPESLARVLTLYYMEDIPQKEIADIEGISVAAVKTRIHRAKKAFKDISLNLAF